MSEERELEDILAEAGEAQANYMGNEPIEEVEEIEEAEEVEEIEEVEEVEEKPKGYLSHDEWIEAGKDPDLYKGKKAYSAEYDRIQEIKDLTSTQKETNDIIKALASTMEQEKQNAAEKAVGEERARLEAQRSSQVESLDAAGAVETERKINALNTPSEQPQGEPEVISNYRTENPIIDKSSSSYDAEFEAAMEKAVNNDLQRYQPQDDAMFQRILAKNYNDTKALFPDKFESPKNTRQTAVTKPKPAKKASNSFDGSVKLTGNHGTSGTANEVIAILKATGADEATIKAFKTNMGK